ncbi:hypothetical protein PR202_gb29211 [Eleusine coracana subsp. coracana]|uniref:Uncharacterized protein n=1 Tax=Eleusine coracana subsp. coracana TaxID=191504 RepID=A0AAV5FYD4_ELECO|nr:hypothetical protein PR202_gb29211 [Eleusine coracana subsp. coracana]
MAKVRTAKDKRATSRLLDRAFTIGEKHVYCLLVVMGFVIIYLVFRRGEEIQCPCEGVVHRDLIRATVFKQEASIAAVGDLLTGAGVVVVGEPGEEDVSAADNSGEVRVMATADGHERGDVRADGFKKKPSRGFGWSSRKQQQKAGEERTAVRKVGQARAAQTRLGRDGRRRKISRMRSDSRSKMLVRIGVSSAGGGHRRGSGCCSDAIGNAGLVQCGLPELENEVDEKIDQFIAWAEKHPNRRSQV